MIGPPTHIRVLSYLTPSSQGHVHQTIVLSLVALECTLSSHKAMNTRHRDISVKFYNRYNLHPGRGFQLFTVLFD